VVPTFVLDVDSRVIIWNKACERLTGVRAEDVLGTDNYWHAFYEERRPCLADLVLAQRYDEISKLYANSGNFGLSDHGVSAENWCVMPMLGHRLYLAIDAGPIYDDSGGLTAVVETLRDITSQKLTQTNLESLAARDGLTGLLNRRTFDERLAEEARRARRERQPLALLMIDIDCFKLFNDTYGHQKGDECLKAVARAIADTLWRAGDMAARYGGEEFAVILPDTPLSGAMLIAERVRKAVEDLGVEHATSVAINRVTLSIGGSVSIDPCAAPEELVSFADAALYRAKREGRNQCVIAKRPTRNSNRTMTLPSQPTHQEESEG
jgi:diguanylate cyclase (GGDEF)-like protein/PAS domain S-box-containing protein